MTRKDYVLIAEVINDRVVNDEYLAHFGWSDHDMETAKYVLSDLATFMSARLARDNPRFDRDRFLEACGVTS